MGCAFSFLTSCVQSRTSKLVPNVNAIGNDENVDTQQNESKNCIRTQGSVVSVVQMYKYIFAIPVFSWSTIIMRLISASQGNLGGFRLCHSKNLLSPPWGSDVFLWPSLTGSQFSVIPIYTLLATTDPPSIPTLKTMCPSQNPPTTPPLTFTGDN